MSRNQQSSGATGEVGAPSRRDDRSGLLDIRALSSIVEAQRSGGGPSASSVAMPSFGTGWALQSVSTAVPELRVRENARAVPGTGPNTVVGPDHRPLYVMIAALSVAVASLGAYVLMRPPPTVVVERTAAAAVGSEVVEGEGAEGDAEAKSDVEAEAKAKAEAEAEAKADAALAAADAAAEPPSDAKPDATARARVHRTPRTSDSPKTPPTVDPKPKVGGAISVECVIDPSKCDGKGKTKPIVDEGNDEPADSKALPPAPSSTQIRDAMAPVKPSAKACAARHGGKAGDKVRVKLSVSGSTGKVTSALALDDYAGTPLGKCVADALAKAELPKFSKPTAGIVYAVTL